MEKLPSIRELFSESFLISAGINCHNTSLSRHSSFINTNSSNLFTAGYKISNLQKDLRQRMSPYQTLFLDEVFRITQFPDGPARHRLAKKLNLTPRKIQVWFQNRRQKLRHGN
ncbi:Short stature homeobox protein 2 [Entomophthora muscae]|uniref:Short stature homeobox protein 2 n=1 Tax=Entomophthora muscae TaxID=34485 RepID=A0ACC2RFI9_9FUNG|nr:Short stature homeobox protein 2 [Entomophthora muscae]